MPRRSQPKTAADLDTLELELAAEQAFGAMAYQAYARLSFLLDPAVEREREIKADIARSWNDLHGGRAARQALFKKLDALAANYGRRRTAMRELKRELKAHLHAQQALRQLLEHGGRKPCSLLPDGQNAITETELSGDPEE